MLRRYLTLSVWLYICASMLFVLPVALAKEVDDDQQIGAAGGSVHVDPFTGTATTSIPLNVLSGRNGVQPNLQLTYSSSNGNGWVGMGWKLELGAIERSTKFGVSYDETPSNNGKVYAVRMSGVSAELIKLDPNNATDPEYRAKVEGGFFRIRKLVPAGLEVTDRKGVKYLFGASADARVEDPSNASRVFRWNLERIEDRDGNYMLVTYTKDQGQSYPAQIDYTYSTKDVSPTSAHSVKFYLENPAGMTAPDTYNAFFKVTTAKRLRAVEILANNTRMRAYELTYTPSTSSSAYLLTKVEQFDRNASIDPVTHDVTGSALPPTTVSYTASAPTFAASTTDWLTGWCSGGTQINPGDLNGDGRQDLWCFNPSGGITGARANSDSTLTNTGTGVTGCTTIGIGDFNGDGRQDAACYVNYQNPTPCSPPRSATCLNQAFNYWTRINVSLADQTGVFSSTSPTWIGGQWGQNTDDLGIGIMDIDGDGQADLWCRGVFITGAVTLAFARSTGNNTFSVIGSTSSPCTTAMGSADFNGDGKADLWCYDSTVGTVSVSYSTSTSTAASFTAPLSLNGACSFGPSGPNPFPTGTVAFPVGKFYLSDFNGDGLQDFWCHIAGFDVRVALSTGTSFTAPSPWRSAWCGSGTTGVADFNGDGVSDLWCHTSDGTTQVSLSTGTTFTNPVPWSSGFCAVGTFGTADLNGDGKPDLWCVNNGNVSVATAGDSSVKSDLLASISNGLGASSTLTYTPSTQLAAIHTLLPYPLQVVTKLASTVTTSVGSGIGGLVHETNYQYEKGYHSLPNREFRGFKTATVTACANCSIAEKSVTVTDFHQGSGTSTTEDTGTILEAPDAPTKGLPYRILVQDGNLSPLMETVTTYTVDQDSQAPWFTPAAQVLTRVYANGAIAMATQAESIYDHTYGNVVRESHYGDVAISGDEKTIERDFANDTTNWLLGFPTRETIYKGISTAPQDKMAESLFYYDGTSTCASASTLQVPTIGHLTRTVNWLSGGVNPDTRMAYDIYGNKVCQRDPKGNQITYAYDGTHTFIKTVTNPLGHIATTLYAGIDGQSLTSGIYGQVLSVTDPNGKITASTYDTFGRKFVTATPDGMMTVIFYNYGGTFGVGTQHVQSSTSGGGLFATFVSKAYFDGLGRTIRKESPGATDGSGSMKVLVSESQYDIRGLVKQSSLPYFKTTESATGRWTTMTYDTLGRMVKSTNPDNTSSQVCYSGWTTTFLDQKFHKRVETKDAYGRLVTVQEYTGTQANCLTTGGTLYATTNYTYNQLGNLLMVTDTKGNVSAITYDTLGRKLTMHDPDMGNWSYSYDANGNLLTQVDAKNQKLCFAYDALNRRTQKNYGTTTVACGNNTVVYTYDDPVAANNGKGRLKQVTDPAQSVTFQYDSQGRIIQSAKTLDGSTYTTTSAYDGLGRLTSVSYPTTPIKTVTYTYDGPQLKSVQEGATIYVTYGGWNALGQPATSTFGNGVVTTHTYANTANAACIQQTFRLCTLKTNGPSMGGGTSGTLTFIPEADTDLRSDEPDTALGNLNHVVIDTSPMREAYLRFNITGLPSGATITSASLTLVNGGYATPESNDGGAIFKFAPSDPAWVENVPTWNARAGLTGTDASGLLSKVGAVNPGASYTFANLQSAISGNGRVTFVIRPQSTDGAGYFTKEATVAGQRPVLTVQYTTSSSPGASYQDLRYTYEANGNVGDIYDATVAANAGDQHFAYDDLDRLTLANGPYGASGVNASFPYSYDQIGNMTVNPQVGIYSYPASGLSSVRPHAASVAGPYPISYDSNGNVVTMTDPTGFYGYAAIYDPENHLSSVTTSYGGVPTTAMFVYDGDGGRVKKTIGTTTTRYISKFYECDTSGGVTSCSRFVWAGSIRIATVASNGAVHYWHGDHLGSSSVITDSTGGRVQAITYFPYGDYRTNNSFTTPAVDVPYKYTGKERDASSNLYYYESRYYHPVFGRFVSPDTIVPNPRDPQSLNRYAYARNNPLLYTDPSGHDFGIGAAIAIGVIVGAIVSGVQSHWDINATLTGAVIGGVSAGVGAGVGSSVYAATLSSLGATGAGIAGGIVGGAVAGGTSGLLASAAGYHVNIGLAIASGAAAGGIGGGAYGQWGAEGAFLAAPVAGASAAAIRGSDPGVGAFIAAASAAFSLGVQSQSSPAEMSRGGGWSGVNLSMKDVALALDVIGKSSLLADPPAGYTDANGIATNLRAMFENGQINFGLTDDANARAEYHHYSKAIVLNPANINLGVCPLCDLPGTLFHEGVHAFYGDPVSIPRIENRAYDFQYELEIRLYNDKALVRPLTQPYNHRGR